MAVLNWHQRNKQAIADRATLWQKTNPENNATLVELQLLVKNLEKVS